MVEPASEEFEGLGSGVGVALGDGEGEELDSTFIVLDALAKSLETRRVMYPTARR